MEPEGLLPHSQVPATCPYPEAAQSSPYTHILLPEDPSPKWPLSLRSPHLLSYPPYMLHTPPISFFLILSPEQYWVRSKDH